MLSFAESENSLLIALLQECLEESREIINVLEKLPQNRTHTFPTVKLK